MTSMESEASATVSSEPISAHPSVSVTEAPSIDESPVVTADERNHSESSISGSDEDSTRPANQRLQRPKMSSRKSSGTIIVARDSPNIEMRHEEYDEDDARTMSPRRTSEEIERMGEDARQALMNQAKQLQASLLQVVERVESVRSEHEKLEGGNRFLQSYIGELMQTSKITSTGAAKSKSKGKGRTAK